MKTDSEVHELKMQVAELVSLSAEYVRNLRVISNLLEDTLPPIQTDCEAVEVFVEGISIGRERPDWFIFEPKQLTKRITAAQRELALATVAAVESENAAILLKYEQVKQQIREEL